ncbi:glycosyltransferase family 4 protein [Psychroserpens sp.]|uniref:glycosyltransferase family 4 protein n=1 Tax=Psychroserpens sp. TaxID=2020870 RepID=UPI001B14214A|nr:glycosyltransferase family 4 protein [Psychroserpens sp.]MBO6606965.1 glycosyltransferase family 4 protein [Psychroserpens sp.]MBO6630994.1 glycosyltransferase family 4 protein [Psychroserpens sp.]MBO6654111.1 glycosyltransferase family 4 protein [Psychroserpens sp.]MBO6682603.1 glycosyltransferase family 4 protein [Psychroserpens sp.]MBO6750737.1 glycosyltransferase family 4 protein [Psychroserpens sp.]
MSSKTSHNKIIGLVLSTAPKYSETFFRNKISGLQDNGFKVILFVDYKSKHDNDFPCEIVVAPNFGGSKMKTFFNSFLSLLKCLVLYPKKSARFLSLEKKSGFTLRQRLKRLILNQFLFQKHVDWLHFGFGNLAISRENVAEAKGAKMAVSFRGSDFYLSPLKHKDCYQLLFQKEVKYHVLSNEMKQDVMAHNIAFDNIQVITPAINTSFFKAPQMPNTIGKTVKLITVARLHWKKGLIYTLEAMKVLRDREIDFHYTIIGSGEEYERIKFAINQLELNHRVTLLGELKQEDIKKQLKSSDIYIQYSIQEGFCNAALEAQAMGLMCVVSNAEGLSENVLNNKTGWVIPKRQPELLAGKIIEILGLPDAVKNEIRKTAIERVKNQFNLEKQNAAFKAFYSNYDIQ